MTTRRDHLRYVAWMQGLIREEPRKAARKCLEEQLQRAESHWRETHPGAK